MVIDVKMPQLGESVTEGTVTKWLVKEGDVIKKDQPLLEVATDKADTEVPAPAGGRVVKLLVRENDVVPVHSVLLQLDDSAAGASAPEHLVTGIVEAFRARYNATIEHVVTRQENIGFNVPRELREAGAP